MFSYPSGWFFFDPTQPAPADLAASSAEVGARVDANEIEALVSRMTGGQGEAVVGLGLQAGQSSSNFILALAYEAGGMTLQQFAQQAAAELAGENGIDTGSSGALEEAGAAVELVTNLREGEEVVAIRFREDASLYEGIPGQSHLNSDATIAHEGRPQGAPLQFVNLFRPRNRPPVAKDL